MVHQGFHDSVVGATIDIAQNEGQSPQLCLCTEEGQDMGTALILRAFPLCDVVVGIAGVLARSVEDDGMQTSFETDSIERLVREAWLQPEARKGVARGLIAAELIILKECERLYIHGKRARIVVGQAVVSGRKTCGKVLGVSYLETGQDEEDDDDFAHGGRG